MAKSGTERVCSTGHMSPLPMATPVKLIRTSSETGGPLFFTRM
jgi:hypothetical protein